MAGNPVGTLARIVLMMLCAALTYNAITYFTVVRPVTFAVPPPAVADFQRRYGAVRNLSHVQTRRAYHEAVEGAVAQWIAAAQKAGAGKREQAVGCTFARWNARLYARSRDLEGGWMTQRLLGVRDAYQHGIAPHSIRALADIPACLAMVEGWPCPSYPSLMARKPTEDAIIEGCTRPNAVWDKVAETIGEPDTTSGGDL